jgi:hypothetical protein
MNKLPNEGSSLRPHQEMHQTTSMSELSQYTIDSLSLTPLVKASFRQTNLFPKLSSCVSSSTSSLSSAEEAPSRQSINNKIQIQRTGGPDSNDSVIKFPPIAVNDHSTFEMSLANTSRSFVYWKAYAPAPVIARKLDDDKIAKCSLPVFSITPASGTMPAGMTQNIKIEFNPHEIPNGIFTQYWQIDTRTDMFNDIYGGAENNSSCFNSKLTLTGKTLPQLKGSSKTDKKDDKVAKGKSNLPDSSFGSGFYLNAQGSTSTSSLLSSSALSTYSSTSSMSSSGINRDLRVTIKEKCLQFPDTLPNQVSKLSLTVHNKESFDCTLSIMTVMEPFYCKYEQLEIKASHFIRMPIEFRPRTPSDYVDNIIVRVDKKDVMLSCQLKARCVAAKSD